MSMHSDTIAAIATAPGLGGIGIIRISGPDAEPILRKIFRPTGGVCPDRVESHRLMYGTVRDGEKILDECMAVLMRAPRSYTREDVAELQLHGGGYVLSRAMELCLQCGARLAEPGEFTRRAFLNGRIDLSRAEAVMQMISARGEQEHLAAVRQLEGGAAAFVRKAADDLYQLQAGLAACIDYPEEVSDEEGTQALRPGIEELIRTLQGAVDERTSRLLQDGLQVALIGQPNVGKSSLLNALLGEEKAIVTHIPGTTRDLVQGEMILNGVRVVLTDTAGLRETEDPVERIGVQRSEKAYENADLAILILDGSEPLRREDETLLRQLRPNSLVAVNKSDLPLQISADTIRGIRPDLSCLVVSARDEKTLQPLKDRIRAQAEISDRVAVTQPRHADAIRRAVAHLRDALRTLDVLTPDMAAVDLQAAQRALGEITGDQVDEKLLDAVFSRFCVGK